MKSFVWGEGLLTPYSDALRYLYGLPSWQYWVTDREVVPPNLNRFRTLLRHLGSPHRALPFVHVAGTKGKGSTSAMIASTLAHAGYRTGLYTSPHLHTFRERIQVNGEMIAEEEVAELVDWIRPTLAHTPGTTFEAITAIAFEHFRRRGVQVAVLEVGLGGRFDATNVVHPLVAVITSIGRDHMNVLGNTLAQIAGEKAGIIKRGVPVVFTPQEASAAAVLAERARQRRARQVWVGKDWRWQPENHSAQGQHFTLYGPRRGCPWTSPLRGLFIPLIGRHQLDNAAAAVAAVAQVQAQGFPVSEEALRRGLAQVRWPARLEVLQSSPWLIVDSAHTVESVEAALATVQEVMGRPPDVVLFGASADKDVAGMLRQIPPATRLIFARAEHERAMDVAELQRIAQTLGRNAAAIPSPRQALAHALAGVGDGGIVLALGSIFLAAAVREAWLERAGRPMPPKDPV